MRFRRGYAAAVLSLALAAGDVASAQPTDLLRCLPVDPTDCHNIRSDLVLGCDIVKAYERYVGEVAWFPLRCVGPISVAIENIAIPNTRFPLFIQVVPLGERGNACVDPGFVIFTIYGVANQCGGWETSQPIDITPLVPIGSTYAFRLFFLSSGHLHSPAVGCVQVTAHPVTSAIESLGWGRVKALYR
jgi:hypothetical protein